MCLISDCDASITHKKAQTVAKVYMCVCVCVLVIQSQQLNVCLLASSSLVTMAIN